MEMKIHEVKKVTEGNTEISVL